MAISRNNRKYVVSPAGQLNVELLLRVKKQILRKPELFNQEDWYTLLGPGGSRQFDIAGWTLKLIGLDVAKVNRTPELAQAVLGLDDRQADSLFLNWPRVFASRYNPAWSYAAQKRNACAAADRIDHLIATGR